MRTVQAAVALLFATALLVLTPTVAHAQRIKDLAKVKGVRQVPLTGIGLIIGLDGTGDGQRNALLKEYYVQVLSNMGTGIQPSVADVKTRNAALVMVNATVPSSTKTDTEFEVNVSSVGDAESLRGGFLLAVPLKLPQAHEPGEGVEYAIAHGPVYPLTEGDGKSARAKTHAVLRKPLEEQPFLSNLETITLQLDKPDFGTASEIARKINAFDLLQDFDTNSDTGPLALPWESGAVTVRIPTSYLREDRIVDFISQVLEIEVADVEREAMEAVDRQKGSVVVNGAVLVSLPAVIEYKGAIIKLGGTPGGAAGGDGGATTDSSGSQRLLVEVLTALQSPEIAFTGADVIHILEQMNKVGAIKGKFVERWV